MYKQWYNWIVSGALTLVLIFGYSLLVIPLLGIVFGLLKEILT